MIRAWIRVQEWGLLFPRTTTTAKNPYFTDNDAAVGRMLQGWVGRLKAKCSVQVMRTPQGTPVQAENMANVQYAVQDIIDRGDVLAGA